MIKKIFKLVLITVYLLSLACASKRVVSDDDFGVDSTADSEELSLDDSIADNTATVEADEFAEFENENPAEATPTEQASEPVAEQPPAVEQPPLQAETAPVEPPVEPAVEATPPPEVIAASPEIQAPVVDSSNQSLSKIKEVKFLGNDNGGTLVITADQPLNYKTRMNSDMNQMVVEVQNVILPEKFKRPLNTKDMISVIGSVDAYQNRNSNVARFVIQLKSNIGEPLVQPEGNSLLIVAAPTANMISASQSGAQSNLPLGSQNDVNNISKMSNGSNLEDFMANNTQFYGRPISIETTNMNIIDILKFISEEGGINMIFDDGITGTMSLKLRKVPWDQALTIVLKSKRLGYRRQGEVFRIALLTTLTTEEDEALRLRESRMRVEPLIVKNFQINYANVAELETKIRDFLSESGSTTTPGAATAGRGRVTSDARTNTMIVTDTAVRISQVEKLLQVLDVQPQQVLIEGRVVEASESYSRSIGMRLGLNRADSGITGSSRIITRYNANTSNPLLISPSIGTNPSVGTGGVFDGSLWLGKFGPFGDLAASLSLDENESKVKILSSPRVTVLHGQEAKINQTTTIQIPSTAPPVAGVAQQITFATFGVKLTVTPFISGLGTVNLKLFIERSAIVPNSSNTTNRDITTNIIVRSGDTAVIGGVFQADTAQSESGVPGLKDIPVLGTLFKGQSKQKSKNELMFFISPQILKPVVDGMIKADASGDQSNQ